jgi:multiple sugar transport system ATP-binding protein
MAEVQLKDVDKVYEGGVHAVQDLSIDVADGEFLVLVGPSGCGKTTALRMVAGLESITDGTITIGDRIVNDLSPKDRDIAMVFQNYALYPHLSVADNIAFGLRLRKTPKRVVEERIAWAAKLLDLTPYLARKPKELSGGQKQRVAMGRAIVREPQVFLMDEPLSNLDAKLRIQMRAEIAKLQHELGTTTIYVTHDQVEAMTMGDRVAVMSMGVLQQVDRPQALYDAPQSVFVASFIGTPPMNLFRGTISTDNGTVSVSLGGTTLAVEQSCVVRYGGIRALSGKDVVVGIRAEDVHPASARPDLPTMDATVELVEALGSGVMAHFNCAAPSARGAGTKGAGPVADVDEALGSQPNLVAQFPPRVNLKLAETVPVAVDPGALHFFDEETGAALT